MINKKQVLTVIIFFILGAFLFYNINKPQLNQSKNNKVAVLHTLLIDKYFPIEKGSFWEYEGVKKEDVGSGKIETSNIKKRVEVVDVQETSYSRLVTLGGSEPSKILIKDNTIDFDPDKSPEAKFILKFPLEVGQKWGDEEFLKRDDGFYVYLVEEKLSEEFMEKKFDDCFKITFKTNADSEYKVFCYGLGIVEEGYKHNGTVLEWNYKLTSSNKI